MTALSAERTTTTRMDASGAAAPPDNMNANVGASVTAYQGGMACFQPSSGSFVNASATTGLLGVGRWTQDVVAGVPANLNVDQGTFPWASGTGVDLITEANVGGIAWIIDDQTVGLTSGGGARSPAGIIVQVDSNGAVWVQMSIAMAATLAAILGLSGGTSTPANYARAVVTSLAAYGGTTTGVLTASANGAFGTQDGITTLAVGDVVFIPEGTTNLSAASDAGPYVITALGATGAKWVLTRPSWWATGSEFSFGAIKIGSEGTFWFGTEWKSFSAKGSQTIDTSAPKFYPGRVAFSVTLVAGTKTISGQTGVPIFSAASGVSITRTTANTSTATTGGYACNGAPTPGVLGTASLTVFATVAAGTINNADVSTLTVTITNW